MSAAVKPSSAPTRLVVDCDTGIDDALALLYLLARPDAEIVAAGSVFGNSGAQQAATNTLRVLEVGGRPDIPVAVGAARPLAAAFVPDQVVHGKDGLGNTNQPLPAAAPAGGSAAEQLVRLARAEPGELTVLAIGSLTNLALALLLEPNLPHLVARVVIMGGAFSTPGNMNALAEFNIFTDPDAARLVFDAGWPITLVSLDVTRQATLGADMLGRLRDVSGAANFAWAITQHYFDFYFSRYGSRQCSVHDMLAAALTLEPELATYEQVAVGVETAGVFSRGATVVDRREGAAHAGPVALARTIDGSGVIARLLDALRALP